ncbi:hypothetical protein AB0L82_17780 [Nocardia sp. NPDC052001]|uniref:hypothetical protein n=1 Tax=Nocardia sp. NPDC052001 TaxID=3154853 RepID=UPI00342C3632
MALIVVSGAGSFAPSGMTKSGSSQKLTGSYAEITNWTADTTGYPGSTLSGNGVRSQGANTAAVLTASLPFSGGGSSTNSQQARLFVNGVAAGSPGPSVNGTSGTLTATATVNLADGDVVTVQAYCNPQLTGWEPNIQTGAATFVRIN